MKKFFKRCKLCYVNEYTGQSLIKYVTDVNKAKTICKQNMNKLLFQHAGNLIEIVSDSVNVYPALGHQTGAIVIVIDIRATGIFPSK